MKTIIILITLLLTCGIANATPIDEDQHYIIAAIVWDNVTGLPESDVPVTFGGIHTLYTGADGSVVYDTANLDNIEDGSYVSVSCKYGIKNAPVIYGNWGTGITFNEPDENTAIEAFAALGFFAIALGGGRYLLRRRKNTIHKGDTMDENKIIETTGSKLIRDFGVRALIATLSILGYIGISGIAVYRGDMSMLENISKIFMPIILAIIVFYFNGSTVRDASKK